MKKMLAFIGFSLILLVLKASPIKATDEECWKCHQLKGFGYWEKEKYHDLYLSLQGFSHSPHRNFSCTDCHSDIIQIPHRDIPRRYSCAECHPQEIKEYEKSVHQQNEIECFDCHNPHFPGGFKGDEPTSSIAICQQCHQDYLWLHQGKFPYYQAHLKSLACQSCHVLPNFKGDFVFAHRVSDGRLTPFKIFTPPESQDKVLVPVEAHKIYPGQAIQDCRVCHTENSLFYRTISLKLAETQIKTVGMKEKVAFDGHELMVEEIREEEYLLGTRPWKFLDWGGLMLVLVTALGVLVHALLRIYFRRRGG